MHFKPNRHGFWKSFLGVFAPTIFFAPLKVRPSFMHRAAPEPWWAADAKAMARDSEKVLASGRKSWEAVKPPA